MWILDRKLQTPIGAIRTDKGGHHPAKGDIASNHIQKSTLVPLNPSVNALYSSWSYRSTGVPLMTPNHRLKKLNLQNIIGPWKKIVACRLIRHVTFPVVFFLGGGSNRRASSCVEEIANYECNLSARCLCKLVRLIIRRLLKVNFLLAISNLLRILHLLRNISTPHLLRHLLY